jgi:hypothetical protein
MKKCIKCNIEKKDTLFPIRKESKDGRRGHCRECEKKRKKEYRERNPHITNLYYLKNKEKLKIYHNEFNKKKLKECPLFRLKHNMRVRIKEYFKVNKLAKHNKTFDMVGITPLGLKEYIEKKFKYDMSWDNYGKWHIDHIIPLASAKTEIDIIKLCHYTNLQPLWAKENWAKGCK